MFVRFLFVTALGTLIALALFAVIASQFHFRLTYQYSKSMPKGWYFIEPLPTHIHRGDILVFTPPKSIQPFLYHHKWINEHTWMMKRALGLPGDFVCTRDQTLFINHQVIGKILTEYKPGFVLPQLPLCQKLAPNHFMMISTYIKRSFDSRYFGPVTRSNLYGKAIPL